MSFRRVPASRSNRYHHTLFIDPEPDYDELLFRLSRYAFDRLSPRDQQEQVEEIRRRNVKPNDVLDIVEEQDPEESEEAFRRRAFAKLFKKLSYSDQLDLFLSKVTEKFKRERQLEEFISSFKQLDADQQLSRQVKGATLKKRHANESEYDFKLRKFTELCKKVADFTVQDGFLHFAEVKATILLE